MLWDFNTWRLIAFHISRVIKHKARACATNVVYMDFWDFHDLSKEKSSSYVYDDYVQAMYERSFSCEGHGT